MRQHSRLWVHYKTKLSYNNSYMYHVVIFISNLRIITQLFLHLSRSQISSRILQEIAYKICEKITDYKKIQENHFCNLRSYNISKQKVKNFEHLLKRKILFFGNLVVFAWFIHFLAYNLNVNWSSSCHITEVKATKLRNKCSKGQNKWSEIN